MKIESLAVIVHASNFVDIILRVARGLWPRGSASEGANNEALLVALPRNHKSIINTKNLTRQYPLVALGRDQKDHCLRTIIQCV